MSASPGEMLLPPDVEAAIIAHLDAHGLTAATTVPNPRPESESYVRVTRTGGQARNLVESDATVLVECWAPTTLAAFGLAQLAWGLVWTLGVSGFPTIPAGATTLRVAAVSATDPVNFPDPDTSSPRYQFIATVTAVLQRVAL